MKSLDWSRRILLCLFLCSSLIVGCRQDVSGVRTSEERNMASRLHDLGVKFGEIKFTNGRWYVEIRTLPDGGLQELLKMPVSKSLFPSDKRYSEDKQVFRNLAFSCLDLSGTPIASADALQSMTIDKLHFRDCTNLSDISGLQGMDLQVLVLSGTRVSDVLPLQSISSLTQLSINRTLVSDLSPLKNLSLFWLDASDSNVSNLTPVVVMPLRWLYLHNSAISEIGPLAHIVTLKVLTLDGTLVTDLQPLSGLELGTLHLPAAVDLAPIESLPLVHLYTSKVHPDDLARLPVDTLRRLSISDSQVTDLTFVLQSSIEDLWLYDCSISDLKPLRDSKVQRLVLDGSSLPDLKPLSRMKYLQELRLSRTGVTHLKPLKGLTLDRLYIYDSAINDLTGIDQIEVKRLGLSINSITAGHEALRKSTYVQELSIEPTGGWMNAKEFWRRSDAASLDYSGVEEN